MIDTDHNKSEINLNIKLSLRSLLKRLNCQMLQKKEQYLVYQELLQAYCIEPTMEHLKFTELKYTAEPFSNMKTRSYISVQETSLSKLLSEIEGIAKGHLQKNPNFAFDSNLSWSNIWENNDKVIKKDSIIVFGIMKDLRQNKIEPLFQRLQETKPLFEEVRTTQMIYIILMHNGKPELYPQNRRKAAEANLKYIQQDHQDSNGIIFADIFIKMDYVFGTIPRGEERIISVLFQEIRKLEEKNVELTREKENLQQGKTRLSNQFKVLTDLMKAWEEPNEDDNVLGKRHQAMEETSSNFKKPLRDLFLSNKSESQFEEKQVNKRLKTVSITKVVSLNRFVFMILIRRNHFRQWRINQTFKKPRRFRSLLITTFKFIRFSSHLNPMRLQLNQTIIQRLLRTYHLSITSTSNLIIFKDSI